jgi:hypothetical protein
MNIMEQLKANPVLLYGIAGVFAGNLLGGTKKSRTGQAVVYGALGAAIGWFVNKGNQQQQQAEISKVIAIESAQTAAEAADAADSATDGFGVAYFGRAGRPAKGTRAYRRARQMLYRNRMGQSQQQQQQQQQAYSNGCDDGGNDSFSMLAGAGVGML